MKDWKMRGSTVYLYTILAVLLGFLVPFFGLEWVAPFAGVFFYFVLRSRGRIREFDWLEVFLVVAYTLGLLFSLVTFGIVAFNSIPWWKILLVGMAADLIASIGGSLPGPGDVASAILVFILGMTIIGGVFGIVISFSIAFISLVPGPSLVANTAFLMLFKIVSELVRMVVL